ncbi:MAG: pyridoxal 5'-phosphate synthase glutaminase subunit PdxT [Bacillota bacterium]|jgi:5'-phosphate synthase pdxT subunit
MKIGVLGLQGAVREHLWALEKCGVETIVAKKSEDLADLAGLVIPGGESTTVGKLLVRFGLLEPIKERVRQGMGIFGTCTGMILLAKEIRGSDQPRLGLMDLTIERNAFGPQVESFEMELPVPVLGEEPYHAIFIRAPYAVAAGPGAEVLAKLNGKIVLARQGKLLGAAFHPELTDDLRIHKLFLSMLAEKTGV